MNYTQRKKKKEKRKKILINKRKKKLTNKKKRGGSGKKSLQELLALYKKPPPSPSPSPSPSHSHVFKSIIPMKEQLTSYMSAKPDISINELNEHRTISLLFIIIDQLPTEQIWRDWINNSDRIKIYIHAKHPARVKSKWIQEHLVKSNLVPRWGSVELSKAMMLLLQNAISTPTDFYMYLSESCIPVYNSIDFFNKLDTITQSSFKYYNTPNNGYTNQKQFDPLREIIPNECIYKTDQWVLLNKTNAKQLVEFERQYKLENIMRGVHASDEMWVASILCIINNGLETINDQRITFVEWENGNPSPTIFSVITPKLIRQARDNNCLFLRKIVNNSRCWNIQQTQLLDQWKHSTSDITGVTPLKI